MLVLGKNVGLATLDVELYDRDIADGTVKFPPARRIQVRIPSMLAAPAVSLLAELTL